jgi:type III secretion protein O
MHETRKLGRLLSIKTFRESNAEREVLARRRALEKALSERDDAHRRLEDFRGFAAQEERRIFGELCERVVQVRDIEDAHGDVRVLKSRCLEHQKELGTAESNRTASETHLDDARADLVQARLARDRFETLFDGVVREARADAERKEEASIEEAAETQRQNAATGEFA